MDQRENARLCMIEWLSHENELGKEPQQIEIVDEFDLHDLHYYIFKFKKSLFSPWLVSVCGGYKEDKIGHCGHIFSEYQNYDARNAKQHCIEMVERIREYWVQQAQLQEVPPQPRSTFINFVLLENSCVDFQKIFCYLKEHWKIDTADFKNSGDSIYVGNVGESIVSLSLMMSSVPEGEAEYYAQGCYMWEDAIEKVQKHKVHIIVATVAKGISTKEAMLLQSQFIDACFQLEQAIAVYGDEMVWPKHIYTEVMNDYINENLLPIVVWVYLGVVTNQDGNHIYTLGLKNFGHYELETLPSSISLQNLHQFMFNIVCYIVEEGAVLKEGETIGMTETQKCQMTLSHGLFLDEQTLKIEIVEE